MGGESDHETIWLEPECPECIEKRMEGRLWCQDDVWGECEDCGRKPTKYVRADIAPRVGAAIACATSGKGASDGC